jgi:hypothetical protein
MGVPKQEFGNEVLARSNLQRFFFPGSTFLVPLPGSQTPVWEPASGNSRFAAVTRNRVSGKAFPNRVWERGVGRGVLRYCPRDGCANASFFPLFARTFAASQRLEIAPCSQFAP